MVCLHQLIHRPQGHHHAFPFGYVYCVLLSCMVEYGSRPFSLPLVQSPAQILRFYKYFHKIDFCALPPKNRLTGPPPLCYNTHAKISNAWKALCHVEGALREPAVGASRGAAAWRLAPERAVPKRSSPVGRHGFASVIRAGACWSPSECARRREAGWYRGKLVLSSREQNIAPGTFCCLYGSTETR